MDLKCSIIHKHFFFFSAAILVPFPNILLLKGIITMQKQKVRRIKVLAAGVGRGGALSAFWPGQSPLCPSTRVRGSRFVPISAETFAGLFPQRVTMVREGGQWCGYVW